MRLYTFRRDSGREIATFDSQNFVMTRILASTDPQTFHLACAHLGEGGKIGRHQAVGHQLFLVVEGNGWVSGDDGEKFGITAGEAAFWHDGEWHETTTEYGLMAIVIEADSLEPESFMAALESPDSQLK